MKNYIEGLKEVKGGGNLQHAQTIIDNYYMTTGEVLGHSHPATIEEVSEEAENRLKNLFKRFKDDEMFLGLKTTDQVNQHWDKYYKADFNKFEKLLDASYCISWTTEHQPRTITEIMNDYRATKKITQKDFDTLKNSGSFNNNELENIMLGLPVGQEEVSDV